MMSDGGDADNSGLSDITAEKINDEGTLPSHSENTTAQQEEESANAAATSEEHQESAHTDAAAKEEHVPVTKKILEVATAAGGVAVKISGEVVEKVVEVASEVSAIVAESASTAYNKFSKKENSENADVKSHGEGDESHAAQTEENMSPEGTEKPAEEPKPSLWNKVRRASGSAISATAAAASSAYRAAEPVAQATAHKVADGAKSAYVAAKPVAEATATKVAEVSSGAWNATKESTSRVFDRVRSLSSAKHGDETHGSTQTQTENQTHEPVVEESTKSSDETPEEPN